MTTVQILKKHRVSGPIVAMVARTISIMQRSLDQLRMELALSVAGAKKLAAENGNLRYELIQTKRRLDQQTELNHWLIAQGFQFKCEGNYIAQERRGEINARYSLSRAMAVDLETVRRPDKQRYGFGTSFDRDMMDGYKAREAASVYVDAVCATFRSYVSVAMLEALGKHEEAARLRERLTQWESARPSRV